MSGTTETLPGGFRFGTAEEEKLARDLVHDLMIFGPRHGVRLEIDWHNTPPDNEGIAMVLHVGETALAIWIAGWRPDVAISAHDLFQRAYTTYNAAGAADDMASHYSTKEGARQLQRPAERAELRRDALANLKLSGDQCEALMAVCDDPTNWRRPVPSTAAIIFGEVRK